MQVFLSEESKHALKGIRIGIYKKANYVSTVKKQLLL